MAQSRALVALDVPVEPGELDAIAAVLLGNKWQAVLLNVVEPVPVVAGGGFGAYVPPVEPDLGPSEALLDEAVSHLEGRDIPVVERRVVLGSPVHEIVSAADESGADVIVVMSRTHNLLHRVVLGSILSSLLKAADRPVVVIPESTRSEGLSTALDRLFDAADRADEDVDLTAVRAAAAAHRSDPDGDEPKQQLQSAMQRLEVDHPAIVKAANDVAYYLSGIGL